MRPGSPPNLVRAMVVRAALVLPASLLLPAEMTGQVVFGQVVDAVTGAPVAGASIRAFDADTEQRLVAAADSAGHFAIRLPAGSYAFLVEHFGYETIETESVPVARGEEVRVEIRVGPLPFEMEPLVVQARQRTRTRFQERLEQRGAAGMGRFITREEIEESAAFNVNHLIAREMGLEIASVQGHNVVMMRGRGRSCMPALYLDGARVANDRRFPMDLSHFFTPDMIEGIEIYRSAVAAPPDLSTDGCGAIVVWSRSDWEGRPFTLRRLAIAGGLVALIFLLRGL